MAEAFYEAMNAIAALAPEIPLPKGITAVETDKWRLAVNNSDEQADWEGDGCGAGIPPYSVAAIHKECVQMAIVDAAGGTIGGGMTEDQFIDEMKAIQKDAA